MKTEDCAQLESGCLVITVIIPVYNRAEYVRRCIESVRNQTYRNLEIILVDDGSTDGSGEICDGYAKADARISVIHQENKGLVSARRKGMERASGDVVAFVDSDDWIEPDMYECMVAAYMDGRPDMVASGLVFEQEGWQRTYLDGVEEGTYEKEAIVRKIFPRLMHDGQTGRQGITASLCNKLMDCSMLRDMLEMADNRLTYGEDGAIVYAFVARAEKITVIHHAWYHYVQYSDSMLHVYDIGAFEKIYRLRKWLLEIFADAGNEKTMKEQIDCYLRGFLEAAIKNLFEIDINDSPYLFPYESVPKGSRVILYGAGNVGRFYWKCIRQGGYVELVAWVDRRHIELREGGLPVESLESAIQKEYDYVVIAVYEKEIAEKIREFLIGHGVLEGVIKMGVTYDNCNQLRK